MSKYHVMVIGQSSAEKIEPETIECDFVNSVNGVYQFTVQNPAFINNNPVMEEIVIAYFPQATTIIHLMKP